MSRKRSIVMKAYRLSVNLKLALIVSAMVIAVVSLAYTQRFVDRLRDREESVIRLWADALAQLPEAHMQINPYQEELKALEGLLERLAAEGGLGDEVPARRLQELRQAVIWAQGMPPASELNFITNAILVPNAFGIPAILSDSSQENSLVLWRNVPVPSPDSLARMPEEEIAEAYERLERLRTRMDEVHRPIPIELAGGQLKQYVHYGESGLVRELRIFPYVQLLFVGLFILVGYFGFSYVRRSEQSSLWVGMAKEAAHQLGTPISSLMGWTELMKLGPLSRAQQQEALEEVEKDVSRLRRVANRFSDIGSLPKLKVMALSPVVEATADYIRRRMPQSKRVSLEVSVPASIHSPLNAELFEWVVENLLKNALDAIETQEGRIEIKAYEQDGRNVIDVSDTGKGIDRRHWKNIFRPGYSTKKRGWGLGLSLAKRIVEDYHGGSLVLAHSRPGHGTTFRIILPADRRTGSKKQEARLSRYQDGK